MFSLDEMLQEFLPAHNPPKWQRDFLRKILFEKEINEFAIQYPHLKGIDFVEQVINHFELRCELIDGEQENIPSHGPLVIVSNHPGV